MPDTSKKRVTPSWSLPRGRILLRALQADPLQEYLLYVPEAATSSTRLLVSIHGVSLNSSQHAAMLSPLCEQFDAVLLVPVIDKDLHAGYQRLASRGGSRVDQLLHRLVSEVASLTGIDATRFLLSGYSGGAQFVHRYVMANPHRVERAVAGAAGWYTFPDHTQRYPYGIRSVRTLKGVTFNPEQFLRVPIEVLVGSLDTGMVKLRSTERTVSQQGVTRVDRARNWVMAMRRSALAFGLEPRVTLTEVPEIGHSFQEFCQRGGYVERMGRFLFDAPEEVRPAGNEEVLTEGVQGDRHGGS